MAEVSPFSPNRGATPTPTTQTSPWARLRGGAQTPAPAPTQSPVTTAYQTGDQSLHSGAASEPSASSWQPTGGFGDLAAGFGRDIGDPMIDPGYQWRADQGSRALQRSAAAKGTLLTSGTLMDLMDYNQGLASQEYASAWDRAYRKWMGDHGIFADNRNFNYNSLSDMARMGLSGANSYLGYMGDMGAAGANARAGAQAGSGAMWGNTIRDAGDLAAAAWMWNRPQPNNQSQYLPQGPSFNVDWGAAGPR